MLEYVDLIRVRILWFASFGSNPKHHGDSLGRLRSPEDCQSDYDSSSSVVDDGDEDIASSSIWKPLPFDLNLL
ncbi:hypothetical protein LguiB_005479 [Lonicera macranthoides]